MSGRMPEIQGGMSSDSAGGWDTLRFAATMYAVCRARGVCRARVSAGRGRLPGAGVCRARVSAGYGCLPGTGVCRARVSAGRGASAGYADTGIFPAVYKSSICSPY